MLSLAFVLRVIASLAVLLSLASAARMANALTPESPEVRRLIESGMSYLDKANDNRLGGQCLIGLCFLKHTGQAQHHSIKRAVQTCQKLCRKPPEEIQQDIYSTGIAIMFLCEVNARAHSREIDVLVKSLVHRQKRGGGWGYPSGDNESTGDTSMTQYAVLGLWTAKNHGFDVPGEVIARVANWLIRTQDPGGGWGYQGRDPGTFNRVNQANVRHALVAAGLGSSYICAHLLDISREADVRQIKGLPPAFQKVADRAEPRGDIRRVDAVRLKTAQNHGNAWFANNFAIRDEPWVLYYLYAFERYVSFRELVEKRQQSTTWYDKGVAFLKKSQLDGKYWRNRCGPSVDTSFAVLFLMRGTKKTIQSTIADTTEWTVVGGRGLPKNTSRLRISEGKLVGAPLAKSVEEMLTILEDPDHAEYDDAVEFPAAVEWKKFDAKKQAEQIRRWRRLAQYGKPRTRRLAVAALASSGRLSVAPALIAALRDSDRQVTIAARDGLRRLSRKFEGFGLADRPTPSEVAVAVQRWNKWYQSVHVE